MDSEPDFHSLNYNTMTSGHNFSCWFGDRGWCHPSQSMLSADKSMARSENLLKIWKICKLSWNSTYHPGLSCNHCNAIQIPRHLINFQRLCEFSIILPRLWVISDVLTEKENAVLLYNLCLNGKGIFDWNQTRSSNDNYSYFSSVVALMTPAKMPYQITWHALQTLLFHQY